MKRVFTALLITSTVALGLGGSITSTVALGLGGGSSEFQNAPQQPAQNPPQPVAPQPAPAQPSAGWRSERRRRGQPRRSTEPQCWRVKLSWKRRTVLRPRQQYHYLGWQELEYQQQRAFRGSVRKVSERPASHHAAGNRISGSASADHGQALARQDHSPIDR